MKLKNLLTLVLFSTSFAVMAQSKDLQTNNTKVATAKVMDTPRLTVDTQKETNQSQEELKQQLLENETKSKAARAKRDQISDAVKRRLNKSKKDNRN
ncbi:MAG: hypothetical protein AAF489_09910 [Bacteroidota bacterium]